MLCYKKKNIQFTIIYHKTNVRNSDSLKNAIRYSGKPMLRTTNIGNKISLNLTVNCF